MGVLADHQIEAMSIVDPCVRCPEDFRGLSYGLSSYGYDVRLAGRAKIWQRYPGIALTIDPKQPTEDFFDFYVSDDYFVIPPHSFMLGETIEVIHMPDDCIGIVVGKSTYARCGIVPYVTPLEPGWRGTITMEISNLTSVPARVYVGEGIAQVVFHRGETPCKVTYADKKGKYQDQRGVQTAKI